MKRIAIIAPAPIRGSGGVGRIYNFAHALAKNGYECTFYVFNSEFTNTDSLKDNALLYYGASGFHIVTNLLQLTGVFDLVIATRWDTVSLATKIKSLNKTYLVQDYEAYFNPVGDGSVAAENSYLMGFKPLTYGRWLASKLKDEFGNDPYHFEFGSDTASFRCDIPMERRLETRPSVVFVYQDDKTRRCPRLGIEALGITKHFRPDTNIYFVGSDNKPQLWYEFENVGNLTVEQLNSLYNKCHVGVSLSSSNPSCNAFDMMAAGLPSVDLFRANNLLDVPSGGVLLAHQTQESIADAIIHLLDNPQELIARSRFGQEFMSSRSQNIEVESFLYAIHAILQNGTREKGNKNFYSQIYDKAPVVAEVNRNPATDCFLRNQYPQFAQNKFRSKFGLKPRLSALLFNDQSKSRARPLAQARYYPTSISHIQDTKSAGPTNHSAPTELSARHQRHFRLLKHKFGIDPRLSIELFDSNFYLANNPDVAAAKVDPFVHFVRHGIRERRSPSPFFDVNWYETMYRSSIGPEISPISYYLTQGSLLNQSPSPLFDSIWYLDRNPDLRASGEHPLVHYVKTGEREGRDPSDGFSVNWYLAVNTDVAASGSSPLIHYIRHGHGEGRAPRPAFNDHGKTTRDAFGILLDGQDTSVFEWQPAAVDFEPRTLREKRDVLTAEQRNRLVSFDVWSTIVHRHCHPDEIKLRSARCLLLEGGEDIRPAFRSTVLLMKARMHAENASAPKGDFEYRFSQAIPGWLSVVLKPSCNLARRKDLAVRLLENELNSEIESIELDENIAQAIKGLNRAPIFISDFYMEATFLEKMLDEIGIGKYFSRGYASCDHFLNKRSGTLFQYVLEDFGITSKDLIHVGDNPISDHERPASLGIETAPYISLADEARNHWYAEAFHDLSQNKSAKHAKRILALVTEQTSAPPSGMNSEALALYQAGCRIGLLAFGYCLNVMQDALTRKSTEVAFFAREGILFQKIYELLREHKPFSVEAPPSKLLFVSRRATFAPSLRSFDNSELMRLWTMYWRQSPSAFARSLNLDAEHAAEAAERVGIDFNKVIEAPWADPDFQAFLNDPKFNQYAVADLKKQRGRLERYLKQELELGQHELLVADIGWRGTIQDNIAHLLGTPVRGHYLALFRYLNEQAADSSKVAWLSNENLEGDYALPQKVAPIEMIFNGLGGSTIGYEEAGNGRIEPVREIFRGEEAVVAALAPCQAGMMTIIPALARYVRLHGLVAGDLLALNQKVATDLIEAPPAIIADMFGRLEHNETFGVGAVEAMEEAKFKDAVQASGDADRHYALSSWLGSRWPEGLSRQSVVGTWWAEASLRQRASVPLAITKAQSPALVKFAGERVAFYVADVTYDAEELRTAVNVVKSLVHAGFSAEIHTEDARVTPEVLESLLGDTYAMICPGWGSHRSSTLAIATTSASAGYIASRKISTYKARLVQDHETVFHPLNDSFLIAENSYSSEISHLSVGSWLSHLINNQYKAPAYPFGIGVNTSLYRVIDKFNREDAICFFYEPSNPRRANALSFQALRLFSQCNPNTKIYIFGSNQVPDISFHFEHLGPLTDPEDRNQLYNRCRCALYLNLSNTPRTVFEIMSAGCKIVDVYRYNNLFDRTDDMCVLAYQSAESLALGLQKLFRRTNNDTASSLEYSRNLAPRTLSWENDSIVSHVVNILNGENCHNWGIEPTYIEAPVIADADDSVSVHEFCRHQWRLARNTVSIP